MDTATAGLMLYNVMKQMGDDLRPDHLARTLQFCEACHKRARLEVLQSDSKTASDANDKAIDRCIVAMDEAARGIDARATVDHGVGLYSIMRLRGRDLYC